MSRRPSLAANAAREKTTATTHGSFTMELERNVRQVQYVGGLQCHQCYCQILNSQTGRVEERYVCRRSASLGGTDQDVTDLRNVLAANLRRSDCGRELTSVARLLPVVAEEARASELLDRDLRLARPVGAHQAHVLSGS